MSEQTRTSRNARSQHKPVKKKKRKLWKKILLILVAIFALAILAGGLLFAYYVRDAPELDESKLTDAVSTRFFDPEGNLLAELGAEKRIQLKSSEVPQVLADAVISVEDKRFYQHPGIDPIRIVGSALGNLRAGGITGGGSTLTQQLIKLSFFSTKASDQTLKRKAQEAWLALKLEREKSKEEILTLYINKVYMGNGISGMGTAAETYYGKPASELTTAQAALLAAIPNAPSTFDPYVHPDNAKERRDIVLSTMLDADKISQTEYDEAVATDISDGLQSLSDLTGNRKYIDNYLTSAIDEVQEKTGLDPFTQGMDIYLNINLEQQINLYNIVNDQEIVAFPDDQMQVASTVLDPTTGAVVAQIGGRKVADNVQFGLNRATNDGTNGRDVGSTMKPLIDYGPAIEYLNYSTAKTIVDEPYQYPGTDLSVQNYDRRYLGTITMRQALTDSRNVPAVKTLMEVGVDQADEFLQKLGIHLEEIQGGSAISGPLSTEQLAGGYAAFANAGIYSTPFYVNKIIYPDDTEEIFAPESSQAMKDSTAYIMTDMLKDVVSSGTGTTAAIPGLIQAGKTGTSNYDAEVYDQIKGDKEGVPDVTFVGYTQNYVMSVWTGYDDYFQAIPSSYHSVAASVYKNMMAKLAENVPNTDWEKPDSVVQVGNILYVKGFEQQVRPSSTPTSSSASTTPSVPTPSSSSTQESSVVESSSAPETSSSVTVPSETVPSSEPETSSTPEEVTPPAGGGGDLPEEEVPAA
ncbi:transglycosylase domain-containing protein [Enterococcus timonensis]|uniref:transglycosylase domain-containing protein n=1 Tax=Enterococcus timonensis TaxID=1852364 RepID=UPI0008DB173F|nr:PBP1A family penicillin-binding protein [Enterococcus timonensis]